MKSALKGLLGSKSKGSKRRLRPTGRKAGASKIQTYNSRFPVYNNRIRAVLAPSLPHELTLTFRMCLSRELVCTVGQNGNYADITLTRPAHAIPGPAINMAGGMLPFFHLYERALVTNTTVKARIMNLGLELSADQTKITNKLDVANVLAVLVPADIAQDFGALNADLYERIRDIPGAVSKQLGTPTGGHDSVFLKQSCDVEKFMTQSPNDHRWMVRDLNQVLLPAQDQLQAAGAPVYLILVVLNRPVPAGQTHRFFFDMDFEYTVRFQGLRPLPKVPGDLPALTVAQRQDGFARVNKRDDFLNINNSPLMEMEV